jgi:L-fuconolactonase
MPPCPIIDTHVHWWDPAVVPLPWLDQVRPLARPFLPADLRQAATGLALERVVFVECDVAPGRHLDEARWIASLAAREPLLGAIVAHAPLERGAAAEADLVALTAMPEVRGVRRLLQGEADDAFCLRPAFVDGVRRLPAHGFHFEICVYHRQLGAAVELVRRCPEVRFVLDHVGKPGIREGLLEPWRAQIRELAALPNVVCKLSGLVTEADHVAWTEDQLRPYIDHVVACFGFERLMFGSDWPVATLAADYRRWVETLDRALAGTGEADLRRLYRDNAVAWYRLEM